MSDDTMTVPEDGVFISSVIERVAGEEESNLVRHARRELKALGNGPEINDHVLEMVAIFSAAGHSGYSGFYTIDILERLLRFENLTELTDDPDEWFFHGEDVAGWKGGIWQNVRNGEAFSFDGGKTYYLLSEVRRGQRQPDHVWHKSLSKEKSVAIRTKLYKHKSNHKQVRAVRVTPKNFLELANKAAGTGIQAYALSKVSESGDVSAQRVKVGKLIAQVGDFVVFPVKETKDEIVKAFRVKDDVFEAEYAAV